MLDSLSSALATVLGGVAAVFAGLWARERYRIMKGHLESARRDQAALDTAMARLEAARKAPAKPVDTQGRTDFEKQP